MTFESRLYGGGGCGVVFVRLRGCGIVVRRDERAGKRGRVHLPVPCASILPPARPVPPAASTRVAAVSSCSCWFYRLIPS